MSVKVTDASANLFWYYTYHRPSLVNARMRRATTNSFPSASRSFSPPVRAPPPGASGRPRSLYDLQCTIIRYNTYTMCEYIYIYIYIYA